MYSTLDNIRESLKLAWKYKILWVFALLLATGGGMNFQGLSNFGEEIYQEEDDYQMEQYSGTEKLSYATSLDVNNISRLKQVLGVETNPQERFFEKLGQVDLLFRGVLVGTSFLAFFIYTVFIGFLLKGWSRGAFLAGTLKGIKNKDLDLKNLGKIALANMYRYIKLDLLLVAIILVSIIIIGLVYFLNSLISDSAILISILLSLLLFMAISFLVLALTYSYRRILASRESSVEVMVFGLRTLKNNLGRTIKLVLGNVLVVMVLSIGLVMVIGLLGGVLFVTYSTLFKDGFSTPVLIILGILSGPILIAFVIFLQAFAGFMKTYKEFTWSNLYIHIENIDDNVVSNLIGEQKNE